MNNKKNLFLIHETQKNLIKSAKARVTGTIPYCHGKVPHCSAYVPMILKEFCSSKINGLVMKTFSGK
jgi:hypothetical protein